MITIRIIISNRNLEEGFFFFFFSIRVLSLVNLVDNTPLLANFNEGINSLVDLLRAVGGRQLNPDPGLALGNHWVTEANDIDTSLEHVVRHIRGEPGITEHHRSDGVINALEFEACLLHAAAEEGSVLGQLVTEFSRGKEDVKGFARGADHGRGQGVREEVGAGPLAENGDDLLAAGRVPPGGTPESFSEC